MLRVNPFAAVRPDAGQASRVASLPYDVINTAEAKALSDGNPDSFLHVVRSEIDLPDGTSAYDDAVYSKARENLDALQERGVLVREDAPSLYLYRLVMGDVTQVGVVGCCHVDDYLNNIIKKHEKTRQDKEDDRTRHVQTLNANAGPVFLTYRDDAALDALMQRDMDERPLHHFNADDDVTHTVWRVSDPQAYVDAFAKLPAAYVADGHHRSASAARAGDERRRTNANHTGNEEYNWFLTVLFPSSQLEILSYNRIVKDLNGHTAQALLDQLAELGTVEGTDDPVPSAAGSFCVYLDGRWHRVTIDDVHIDRDDPVASLDVALLESKVLGPMLGIGDIRTDTRIGFVGGIRGTQALEGHVDGGEAAIAFSMYPTSIDQLLDVSDAGLIMPPKSTWFEPKLRSGLFVHTLD